MTASAPNVFVTGATGYIGGDVLTQLIPAHPDWNYILYLREESRVAPLIKQYPSTSFRIVIGDLDKTELLKSEAAAADIVLHYASADHVPSIQAIIEGLGSSATADKQKFLIHTTGSAIYGYPDMEAGNFGNAADKVWDDVANIEEINSIPDSALHRPVDKLVLEADKTYPHLRVAVICPPAILGVGRGPANRRTVQIPIYIELIRKHGRGFYVGAGKSLCSVVHIEDLTDVYLRITEAAAVGGGKADWGRTGYYIVENGTLEWGIVAKRIAEKLHEKGALKSADVESVSAEQSSEIFPLFNAILGANWRVKSTRTRQVLGWAPKRTDFDQEIDSLVDEDLNSSETRLQQFAQGHSPAF